MTDDFDFSELEAQFEDVAPPEHRRPRYPTEAKRCELEGCEYSNFNVRFVALGYALTETYYTIASAIATMRAHGDEILADQLEAPYEDMLMAYHNIGAAYGYWPEEIEGDDAGL